MRVSIRAVPESGPGEAEALAVSVLLQSLSFTDTASGREYHDGEAAVLKISFRAERGARGWAVQASDIESDYMEG